MIIQRRKFLCLIAAPLIVSAANIMPVKTPRAWSENELIAGLFAATTLMWHGERPHSSEEFSAAFAAAALRERANPQCLHLVSQLFA